MRKPDFMFRPPGGDLAAAAALEQQPAATAAAAASCPACRGKHKAHTCGRGASGGAGAKKLRLNSEGASVGDGRGRSDRVVVSVRCVARAPASAAVYSASSFGPDGVTIFKAEPLGFVRRSRRSAACGTCLSSRATRSRPSSSACCGSRRPWLPTAARRQRRAAQGRWCRLAFTRVKPHPHVLGCSNLSVSVDGSSSLSISWLAAAAFHVEKPDCNCKLTPPWCLQKAVGSRGGSRGPIKRTISDALVEKVTETMADRRMGSYIVCHFADPAAAGSAGGVGGAEMALPDDPDLLVDCSGERDSAAAPHDTREAMIRLCAEKHLQFNSIRMGKHSTGTLLSRWLRDLVSHGGPDAAAAAMDEGEGAGGAVLMRTISNTSNGSLDAAFLADETTSLMRTNSGGSLASSLVRTSSAGSIGSLGSIPGIGGGERSSCSSMISAADLDPPPLEQLEQMLVDQPSESALTDPFSGSPRPPLPSGPPPAAAAASDDLLVGEAHACRQLLGRLRRELDGRWAIDPAEAAAKGLAATARLLAAHLPVETVAEAVDLGLAPHNGAVHGMLARLMAEKIGAAANVHGQSGVGSCGPRLQEALAAGGPAARAEAVGLLVAAAAGGAAAVGDCLAQCVDFVVKQSLFSRQPSF